LIAGAAGFALTFANQPTAEAATTTADLSVTASVSSACNVTTSALDIGAYDSLVVNATADKNETTTGSVVVTCASGLAYNVNLGNGLYFSGGRRMQHATDATQFLNYSLFNGAAAGGVAWPAGGIAGAGTGAAISHSVGGRAPMAQTPQAGLYSDTVVATVTF
jgi:spore coat protein U-like protein